MDLSVIHTFLYGDVRRNEMPVWWWYDGSRALLGEGEDLGIASSHLSTRSRLLCSDISSILACTLLSYSVV